MKQDVTLYGHWLPFDPNDMSTLGSALNALADQIEYTTKIHGQPKQLEWIIKDHRGLEPIFRPIEYNGIPLPPSYTCTVGWRAYFGGDK